MLNVVTRINDTASPLDGEIGQTTLKNNTKVCRNYIIRVEGHALNNILCVKFVKTGMFYKSNSVSFLSR